MILGRLDGTFMKACCGQDFLYFLNNDEIILNPGEYFIMIDPIWNKAAEMDKAYKSLAIDVYGSAQYILQPVDHNLGMQMLAAVFKDFA